MSPFERLAVWLDIRPDETRKLSLLFMGAFFIIAFMILARALREGLYLSVFAVETLPYITIAIAVASVPTVGFFARLLAHRSPQRVLMAIVVLVGAGLAILWPFASWKVGIVAFYLWTSLGTLLLTSGFWVIASELFPVRGAKRLFGLIGAGGTAGAMVMGNSLVWMTRHFDLVWLFPLLIGLLAMFMLTQIPLPRLEEHVALGDETGNKSSLIESSLLTWRSPHLRTIALIVMVINIAATLLDYQFKDLVQAHFTTGEQLTSFFGAFYGWTGAIALFIQLFVVARLIRSAGIAVALGITPLIVLLGSVGLLIAPSLWLVTAVRGADATLRKSIYRSASEVLFVPLPAMLRRKTKTFIDSVVDATAEGLGAIIIFLWVTLSGLATRYLSLYVIAAAAYLIYLSRRMGTRYFDTVTEQLTDSGVGAAVSSGVDLGGRDLLSGTFTRIDIQSLLQDSGFETPEPEDKRRRETRAEPEDTLALLRSPDTGSVARVLMRTTEWDDSHVPALTRLLARDQLYDMAAAVLVSLGDRVIPYLIKRLLDENTEFVIRRRIPRVLAKTGGSQVDDALLDALAANRFEIRYRAALSLSRRRERGLPIAEARVESRVWDAIRREVTRDRPVWELQRLLDTFEKDDDKLVLQKAGVRGSLSLEHTFRLLAIVLPPEPVQAAFHGILSEDENLKSFAHEYLEQVLPDDIRERMWPFIGDVSEYQREKAIRPLDQVVSDLMTTGATLFADDDARAALKKLLEEREG